LNARFSGKARLGASSAGTALPENILRLKRYKKGKRYE
jgi:hypothetical protein